MNVKVFSSRNPFIILFSTLLLVMGLMASFTVTETASTTGWQQENPANESNASPERVMGIGIPKHIPIKVKVKNINNDKWAHDLEIEVTNKSDKPIYYLSLLVIPQSDNVADENVAFWLHYGRPQLNNFSTSILSTDVPLLPNETCVLKIPESSADGWERTRIKHDKPQPHKIGLVFQALNFGDGTGFMDTQGTPVNKQAQGALSQNCLSPPNLGQLNSWLQPALFMPVDFLFDSKFANLLNTIFNPQSCCDEGCKKWQSNVYTCQRVCDPNRFEFVFYQELSCSSSEPCRKVQQHYDYCYYEETELACSVYEIFPCCEMCGAEGEGDTCFDGFDNDGDGFVDCAEPSCRIQNYLRTEDCTNLVDDNCNGQVDCNDPDCGDSWLCADLEGCTPNQRRVCEQLMTNCYAGLCYTPILIDTSGNGYELTSAEDGVQFDLGAGQRIQIAWTTPNSDDAWLALDRDGNGQIDSGRELFGNVTEQPSGPLPNGFLALAVFDGRDKGGNRDGRIDDRDAIFKSLRLWQDVNHNGYSEPAELHTLPALSVSAIDVHYKESQRTDQYGNVFRFRSKIYDQRPAGIGRWAWDVFLKMAV
jgi:hypothetical protein